jgi:hypothetical protein
MSVTTKLPRTGRESEQRTLEQERRYIYSGDTRAAFPGLRRNRRVARRRVSTFNLILGILIAGLAMVLYISNIITVNRLVSDVGRLQARYDSLLVATAALRGEIGRKSVYETIGPQAERLGLHLPEGQVETFPIDQERIEDLGSLERTP